MSLINDALKRAKQVRQGNPPEPATGLPLRPVETPPRRNAGQRLVLVSAALIVALPAGLFFWKSLQKSGASQRASVVTGASPALPADVPEPTPKSRPAVTEPVAPAPKPANTVTPATPMPLPAQAEPQPRLLVTSNAPATATESSLPKPAPLRLQGILYRPVDPAAIINGKTTRVGGKIGDAEVVAIKADSVVIVFAGKTNVLSLPQ